MCAVEVPFVCALLQFVDVWDDGTDEPACVCVSVCARSVTKIHPADMTTNSATNHLFFLSAYQHVMLQ